MGLWEILYLGEFWLGKGADGARVRFVLFSCFCFITGFVRARGIVYSISLSHFLRL
jgi:hypothetical protein